jgi:hypothetical protein
MGVAVQQAWRHGEAASNARNMQAWNQRRPCLARRHESRAPTREPPRRACSRGACNRGTCLKQGGPVCSRGGVLSSFGSRLDLWAPNTAADPSRIRLVFRRGGGVRAARAAATCQGVQRLRDATRGREAPRLNTSQAVQCIPGGRRGRVAADGGRGSGASRACSATWTGPCGWFWARMAADRPSPDTACAILMIGLPCQAYAKLMLPLLPAAIMPRCAAAAANFERQGSCCG